MITAGRILVSLIIAIFFTGIYAGLIYYSFISKRKKFNKTKIKKDKFKHINPKKWTKEHKNNVIEFIKKQNELRTPEQKRRIVELGEKFRKEDIKKMFF